MDIELSRYFKPLFKRFWDICLLRKGPEDVPYSPMGLLLVVMAAFVLDGIRVNLLLPKLPAFQLSLALLVHTLAMLMTTGGLLLLLGYAQRIVQTLTALSGTSIILTVLILPFDYLASLNPNHFTMASLVILFVHLWGLVVAGHILSRALSVHRLMGVIIAFGFMMLGMMIFEYLLPRTV